MQLLHSHGSKRSGQDGLSGNFDFHFDLDPADLRPGSRLAERVGLNTNDRNPSRAAMAGFLAAPPRENPTDPPGSSTFAALAKLGLRLEAGKGTEDVLVIDHVDRPSAN